MVGIRFYGAEAALHFFQIFALGAAWSADPEPFVIGQPGVGHDATAIGAFGPFGSMDGSVGLVAIGTPIAAAVAEAFFAGEIFATLAADFDGAGGFFHECVAAGLAVGAEIRGVVGFVRKTGAGMVSLGAFSAKGASTIWTNQISGHESALSQLGIGYCR